MENIAKAKYRIDNFNFFLRTTAGKTYVILLMIVVNTAGYLFYFKMIFEERIAASDEEIPVFIPYIIGAVFSIVISAGSYISIVNNYEDLGKKLYWLSITLSLSTYGMMLLVDAPSFFTISDVLIDGKTTSSIDWHFGVKHFMFILKLFSVIVLAVTPDLITNGISKKIAEEYKEDSYMKSLTTTFDNHQAARIEYDVSEAAKSYMDDSESAEKEVQAILKSLKIKRQKI